MCIDLLIIHTPSDGRGCHFSDWRKRAIFCHFGQDSLIYTGSAILKERHVALMNSGLSGETQGYYCVAAMRQICLRMPFLCALSLRGYSMSRSVRNAIEFEPKKGENLQLLQLEIQLLMRYIRQISVKCIGCSLKPIRGPGSWVIEFFWYDVSSMQDHFSSKSLEVLVDLLALRCSKMTFGTSIEAAG